MPFKQIVYSSDLNEKLIEEVLCDLEVSPSIELKASEDRRLYQKAFDKGLLKMYKITVEEVPYPSVPLEREVTESA